MRFALPMPPILLPALAALLLLHGAAARGFHQRKCISKATLPGARFTAPSFRSAHAPGAGPAAHMAACCGLCMESLSRGDAPHCTAWAFNASAGAGEPNCALFANLRAGAATAGDAAFTSGLMPTAAPRPPPPTPPPFAAAAGEQRNIVLILTDDQDLRLGSMQAMPHTQRLLNR